MSPKPASRTRAEAVAAAAARIAAVSKQLLLALGRQSKALALFVGRQLRRVARWIYHLYLEFEAMFASAAADALLLSWSFRYFFLLVLFQGLLLFGAQRFPILWLPTILLFVLLITATVEVVRNFTRGIAEVSPEYSDHTRDVVTTIIRGVLRTATVLLSIALIVVTVGQYYPLPFPSPFRHPAPIEGSTPPPPARPIRSPEPTTTSTMEAVSAMDTSGTMALLQTTGTDAATGTTSMAVTDGTMGSTSQEPQVDDSAATQTAERLQPERKQPSNCVETNTGHYGFANTQTAASFTVTLYYRDGSDSNRTIIVAPGQTQYVYDFPAGRHNYIVTHRAQVPFMTFPPGAPTVEKDVIDMRGEIYVEQCKTRVTTITSPH